MSTLRSQNEALFQAMQQDQRDASPRFVALRQAYLQLAEVDLSDESKLQENTSLLGRLEDFARIYMVNHGGPHGTEKGRERYDWASQILRMSNHEHTELQGKLNIIVGESRQRYERQLNETPDDMDSLSKLGKLQRNIGTPKFVPEVTDFELKPSLWERFTNALERGIGSFFNFIFNMTTGLVSLAVAAPFTRTGDFEAIANQQDSKMNLVPGTKTGETFPELHPEQGEVDQPVLDDTRRVPINYEEPIPEDPNQRPTMTLCFEQSSEGGTAAMGGDEGQGHAFISLKYTRTDPLTGKPQRYKCTFGFYPHHDVGDYSAFLAMGATGLVIPGSVENDCEHSYSTARTFQVDNRTINKVFVGASEYAKGGYSFLDRSCATFAHDMCELAGLPADNFFAKTDFKGFWPNALKAGSFLGTQTISRIGKHSMLSNANKHISRYERFGQKVINSEDVQRLSNRRFNARMKGYVPSVAAEAARNNWDFHLGSDRYLTEIPEEKEENPDVEYSQWQLGSARMLAEQRKLLSDVESFLKKNKIPKAEARQITDNLSDFMTTYDRLIGNSGKTLFAKDYPWKEGEKPTQAQRREAAMPTSKAIKDYIEGLDEIFRTTFKSDPRLNISFQHMASTLQKLDNTVAQEYRDIQDIFFNKRRKTEYYEDPEILSYLDPGKDSFHLLARLKFSKSNLFKGANQYNSDSYYPPEMLAGLVKSFGSLDAFMEDQKNVRDVKELRGEDSKKFTRVNSPYRNRYRTAERFSYALSSLGTKQQYTEHDLKFIFRELPEGVGKIVISNAKADPVQIYQDLVLTSFMPGIRNTIQTNTKELLKNFVDKQEALESYRGLLPPRDFSRRLFELQSYTQNEISRKVLDFVADKLSNSQDFNTVLNIMKEEAYKAKGYDPEHPEPDKKLEAEKEVFLNLSKRLCTDICLPIANEVIAREYPPVNPQPEGPDPRAQARERQILELEAMVNLCFNRSNLENNSGATKLMDLVRSKFTEGTVLSKKDCETKQKENDRFFQNEYLQDTLKRKRPEDLEALQNLAKEQTRTLSELSRSGRGTAENPDAMEALSRTLVTGMLAKELSGSVGGLEERVTPEFIARETERMRSYGVLEELNKPENRENVENAIGGNIQAKNKLVAALTKAAKQVSGDVKKALDPKVNAQEAIRAEKNATVPSQNPKRRMSFSSNPSGGAKIP